MKVRPIGDQVLVRRAERQTKSAAGIHFVEALAAKSQEGTVVAKGPGRTMRDGSFAGMDGLDVGDVVVFHEHAGVEVVVDGVPHLVLRRDECMATKGAGAAS